MRVNNYFWQVEMYLVCSMCSPQPDGILTVLLGVGGVSPNSSATGYSVLSGVGCSGLGFRVYSFGPRVGCYGSLETMTSFFGIL